MVLILKTRQGRDGSPQWQNEVSLVAVPYTGKAGRCRDRLLGRSKEIPRRHFLTPPAWGFFPLECPVNYCQYAQTHRVPFPCALHFIISYMHGLVFCLHVLSVYSSVLGAWWRQKREWDPLGLELQSHELVGSITRQQTIHNVHLSPDSTIHWARALMS